jgi:hypothetical protein
MLVRREIMEEARSKGIAGGVMRAKRSTNWGRCCRRAAAFLALAIASPVAVAVTATGAYGDSASFTFDALTLTFPSADPDAVPDIAALENPVSVSVRVRGSAATIADLTVIAAGDLLSGSDAIPVDRVSWTGLGSGFLSGALSRYDPQLVGQWFGKRTNANGTLSFRLQNSWDYATGFYSQVVVYTLVSY